MEETKIEKPKTEAPSFVPLGSLVAVEAQLSHVSDSCKNQILILGKKIKELEAKVESTSGNKNQLAVLRQRVEESSQVLKGEMMISRVQVEDGKRGTEKPRCGIESKQVDKEVLTKLEKVTKGIQSGLMAVGSKESLESLKDPAQLLQLVSLFDQFSELTSVIRLEQHASVTEAIEKSEQIDQEVDLELARPRKMLEAFGELVGVMGQ